MQKRVILTIYMSVTCFPEGCHFWKCRWYCCQFTGKIAKKTSILGRE